MQIKTVPLSWLPQCYKVNITISVSREGDKLVRRVSRQFKANCNCGVHVPSLHFAASPNEFPSEKHDFIFRANI